MNNVIWCLLFFTAGWFSAVIGFKVAPFWGNAAAAALIILLFYVMSKRK